MIISIRDKQNLKADVIDSKAYIQKVKEFLSYCQNYVKKTPLKVYLRTLRMKGRIKRKISLITNRDVNLKRVLIKKNS